MKLTFKATGHAPADVEITPSANGVLTVALSKLAPVPPKRTTKPMPAELESPYPAR